jgi:hypothetical protein
LLLILIEKCEHLVLQFFQRIREIVMEQNNSLPKQDRVVSRRAIGKTIAYVAPAVLALVVTSKRPALAASHGATTPPPRQPTPWFPPKWG